MSYNIYIYARPDSNIAYTEVTRSDTGEKIRVNNGSGDNQWYMTTIENVTGNTTFKAFPYGGYSFSEFVVRFGSEDDIQRSTDENPYEYTGTKNIYIRAVAIPSTGSIPEFNWSVSNGSATAEQTQKAYTALTSKGRLLDFSHLVWNDMVDKVCEVLDANDEVWDYRGGLLTAENTKMTNEDREMTAQRFNSFGLNAMNACGINRWTNVQRGDPIIGSVFIDTMESLNEYIRAWLQ